VIHIEIDKILGIDYGGKTTGNCAIAFVEDKEIISFQIPKNRNPDTEIIDFIKQRKINLVFIDAPLSLPIVYQNPNLGSNYHYRQADIETKAMSPMYLGGFTARAMELRNNLRDIEVNETYPKEYLKLFNLDYKEELAKRTLTAAMEFTRMKLKLREEITSKHQFDAILCLFSALRYAKKCHMTYGNEKEGLIYV
jgi:predicted nuclease with RNAse H fold